MTQKNAANPNINRTRTAQNLWQRLHTTSLMLAGAATPFVMHSNYKAQTQDLIKEWVAQMQKGFEGYQNSPHFAQATPQQILWQSGSSTVLQYPKNTAQKGQGAILLIPSLINRANILNLDKTHSFTAFLAAQGYDVFTLDWGELTPAEAEFDINAYITQRLMPALDFVLAHTGQKPHLIGYCMGGTMAAALSVIRQQNLSSLTLLAAPWDFHAADKTIAFRMQAYLHTVTPVMDAHKALPAQWIDWLFSTIDPLFAFNKFRRFASLNPASAQARHFVILEDWLSSGVPLAAPTAKQVLNEWYINNYPANGVWTINEHLINPEALTLPVCVVSTTSDKLVPQESANAFMQQNESVKRISPPLGHIGMMGSLRSTELLWQPLVSWLNSLASCNNT